MPSNITDVDEFTDPVQGPTDGEAATGASVLLGLQDLANRTRYLKNQLEAPQFDSARGQYAVSGTPDGSFRLVLTATSVNELTLASREVTIVTAGLYIMTLALEIKNTSITDPTDIFGQIHDGSTPRVGNKATRYSSDASETVCVSMSIAQQLSAGEKVCVKVGSGTEVAGTAANSILSIARIA